MANESQKILPRIQKLVSKGRGLDIGCGPFKLFSASTGVDVGEYDGVINQRVLDFLQQQPDASFDWVFSSHYLEHEPQVDWVLVECSRVLRPGGSLLVYLPDKGVYLNAAGDDPNGEHVNHWTAGEFVDLILRFTELSIVAVENRNTTPPGHAFTGNGLTEHPDTGRWEYSFFVQARKPHQVNTAK